MTACTDQISTNFMKTILSAVAVALLLGGISMEIYARLLTDNRLGLLALFTLASVVTALVTLRVDRRTGVSEDHVMSEPAERRAVAVVDGDREVGTVKWFNRTKGFGFIVRDDGDEIFVHYRSIQNDDDRRPSLKDGQTVEFVAVERDKGWQAEDVTVA